jgi:hypothetical protein
MTLLKRYAIVFYIFAGLAAGIVGTQAYIWVRDVIADHAFAHAIRHDSELMKDWAFVRRARLAAEKTQ